VDGNKIEIEEIASATDDGVDAARLMEAGGVSVINRLTKVCPYGKESDYTYKLGIAENKNINLEQAIKDMTFTVFLAALTGALGLSAKIGGAPLVIVKGEGYADTPLGCIYTFINYFDAETRGLSFKVTNYAHEKYKDRYIKPVNLYGFKSNYTWYTKPNFKGYTEKETLYQTKEFF